MKQSRDPADVHPPLAAYTHQIELSADERVLVMSGQVGEMDLTRRREAVAAWLGDHRPTMTWLVVAGLALPEYKVEVDAWASRAD